MSFSQALSGLRAQAENIKVISNNIANSQTVGFKTGKVLFADVFAGASSKVGLGVNISAIMQDFRSGDLENTGRNLDLAIAGEGFYRLEKSNGAIVYSRNGQFNRDAQGFLVNGTGQFLTGYGLSDQNDPFSEVIPGGAPQRLRIPPDDIPANATTEVDAIYNLNASTIGTNVSNDDLQTATVVTNNPNPGNTANIQFHFSSSYTIFDSLGNERTITTYFIKTANNVWDAEIAVDGYRAQADIGTADFTLNFDANGNLFDPDDGTVPIVAGGGDITVVVDPNDPEAVTLTLVAANFDLGGAADLEFNLGFNGTTQFNNNSVQNTLEQDGYTSGTLIGLEVEKDGTVTRIYTNEERREAGQIVLSNFINPEGLQPDGDNAWRQTNASGEPVLGEAQTGVFGSIEGGVLENSNVDLAQELVNMIVSQRAYQANSSSIGTQDEMLQTIINL
ncbi:MAG: flagellar hook protein FlgE [Lamprobacter sp.]|uniref:flagellar hook protein FlgE n=1 Tax=Lamprobacter sp. TaxID=3100796 RepID=UPI002B25F246|nr:flagellar hook protein FlgE [Lamprobacter sp.]MEA3639791.1 flagellar hook protein FlgE [Lamprobacter sp.]